MHPAELAELEAFRDPAVAAASSARARRSSEERCASGSTPIGARRCSTACSAWAWPETGEPGGREHLSGRAKTRERYGRIPETAVNAPLMLLESMVIAPITARVTSESTTPYSAIV